LKQIISKPRTSKKGNLTEEIKALLDERVERYNTLSFIENDPVRIPHLFTKKQDIEIAGLIAATLAWGQRITVINKSKDWLQRMDYAPHDFIINSSKKDLSVFKNFKHRTFNETDALVFLNFLKSVYQKHASLEKLFVVDEEELTIEQGLIRFADKFYSHENFQKRTAKHIPSPAKKATCKRLSMYLRWMVRKDNKGVDFGIWHNIKMSQLTCPLDVHVERVARKLKLLKRNTLDWQAVLELTEQLRKLDASDPVKYDFALFGLGIEEGWR
jgi:uncharacterized protein (TIGR02757 family)